MDYSKEHLMWEISRARTLREAGTDEQPVLALVAVVVLAVAA